MTRDEIVRMAQEAAIMPPNWGATENQWRTLHDFAALVAAAERKRLEATAWGASKKWIVEAVAAEREACAEILDANADRCIPSSTFMQLLKSNAAAIRARGQA